MEYKTSISGRIARVMLLFTGMFIGGVLFSLIILVKGSVFSTSTLLLFMLMSIVFLLVGVYCIYKDYENIKHYINS